MNILVACEETQEVTKAFRARGHEAFSCDIQPCSGGRPEWHIQGDVLNYLQPGRWDLLLAFPPCTYICASGLHWNYRVPGRNLLTEYALDFVKKLMCAPVPKIALENPVGCISSRIRRPDQIIQPYDFGEDASKKTCLWLWNLPLLFSTDRIAKVRYSNQTASGQNKLPPSPDRAKMRSKTFPGIAKAMATQWSDFL